MHPRAALPDRLHCQVHLSLQLRNFRFRRLSACRRRPQRGSLLCRIQQLALQEELSLIYHMMFESKSRCRVQQLTLKASLCVVSS